MSCSNGRRDERQRERDRGALYAALRSDDAIVSLNKRLADSQSQTRASGMLLAATRRTVETLEYMWQLVRIDAGSIIHHSRSSSCRSVLQR